jgi:hypothetical protein
MAMLMMNPIFERTWGARAGQKPAGEYWIDIIQAVKRASPNFIFIAEAYWGLEWELQQQGFDYCYDKSLFDRLEHQNAESVRLHLCAGDDYQHKLIRFIENHDEPRAASTFSPERHRAAAVLTATVTGAKLFHEGQFEGRKVRPPVFLGRRPPEPADQALQGFYAKLLGAVDRPVFHTGEWKLAERTGWPDNQSCQNLVAWSWSAPDERYLIVVNLSDATSQARVRVPWTDMRGETIRLTDQLSGVEFDRDGGEIADEGLYVELAPWGSHFLRCARSR